MTVLEAIEAAQARHAATKLRSSPLPVATSEPFKGLAQHHCPAACPCRSIAWMRDALSPDEKHVFGPAEKGALLLAEKAALNRLLKDKQCQEIWARIEPYVAWWLIVTTLDAFAHRPSLRRPDTTETDRHSDWMLAALHHQMLRAFLTEHRGDIQLYLARRAARRTSSGKPRRLRDDTVLRRGDVQQWLADLDQMGSVLRKAPRWLATPTLSLPVAPSRKRGHRAADGRHIVLKLMALMRGGGGLCISSHQRAAFAERLARAALGLSVPPDARTIMQTAAKGLRKKSDAPRSYRKKEGVELRK